MADLTLIRRSSSTLPAKPSPGFAGRICLVGPTVTDDWRLIRSLRRDHQVTLIERAAWIGTGRCLEGVDVLVLEATRGESFGPLLRGLKLRHPGLVVVLAEGGASQQEIAAAFRLGARDYFPAKSRGLLLERIRHLCRQRRTTASDRPLH